MQDEKRAARRGRKSVTIVDVAREVGVSPSTVSLVLRNDWSIPPKTAERVREAMERLGYVYNRRAASLRDMQSKMLGIVVHDLANSVMTEIALGANVVARALGYVQILGHTEDNLENQRAVIQGLREYGVRGLMLSPTYDTSLSELKALRKAGITVVLVGRSLGTGVSSVRSDHDAGIRQAVGYLYSLGHRQIAFVGGQPGTETFRARSEAFRAAMDGHGLRHDVEDVVATGQTLEGGRHGLHELRVRPSGLPSGVVCFNDSVAIGVYAGLREAGLVPGRDVSVVGFDDSSAARALYPALTTVSIGARSLGETATRLLLDLQDRRENEPKELVAPVHLVIRDSCAPVSAR